jgi:hypothetical protein
MAVTQKPIGEVNFRFDLQTLSPKYYRFLAYDLQLNIFYFS